MKYYKPGSEYLDYLYAIDTNIIHTNHLVGVVLRLNEIIYFLPIDSPDASDYDRNHNLRNSTPSIMRMLDPATHEYIGKCLFSNMFPIPYKELYPVSLSEFQGTELTVMEKRLQYVHDYIYRITKAAQRIYRQKERQYQQAYLAACVDFKKLESAAMAWEIEKYNKHYNRFPDSGYFLTNPDKKGITSYDLMNKNTKIAKLEFDNERQIVTSIVEIYHPEYAPLECFDRNTITKEAVTEWFRGRGIPSWRDGLDDFLDNIGVRNKDTLLNKAFGLSLSDQYWLNPVEMKMEWKDINFFENDFDSHDYQQAVFDNRILDPGQIDLYSPDNTSDGMLKKIWITGDDKKRYLLKGSYQGNGMEPFNEVLASGIGRVLGLPHAAYSLSVINGKVVSKCECFIDKNTELISAYSILKFYKVDLKGDGEEVFRKYVEILKNKGLQNAETDLAKMFVLDYIIANSDRHLGNFGVIRNVESLIWERIAPNYDSGQALLSSKKVYEMNFHHVSGCFFNEKTVDFETILQRTAGDIDFEIDFDGLRKEAENWKNTLLDWQSISFISTERIEAITEGLLERISKLEGKYKTCKK